MKPQANEQENQWRQLQSELTLQTLLMCSQQWQEDRDRPSPATGEQWHAAMQWSAQLASHREL